MTDKKKPTTSTERSQVYRAKHRKVGLYETSVLIPDTDVARAEIKHKAAELVARYKK